MKPILFDKNETTFSTRGLGTLPDAISCKVTEERNNIYELEMTYPAEGLHADLLEYGRIILATPYDGGSDQPFRIYSISKPIGGVFTVNAEHVMYQQAQIPVAPFTASTASAALAGIKTNSLVTNPFTYSTDVTRTSTYSETVPRSARDILGGMEGSILQQFGGEYEFDRWNVTLHAARGADNGVTLRYGKNITDLNQETSIEETVTGILPYWTGQLTDDTTKEQYMYTVTGDVLYASNHAQFPVEKISIVDVSSYFSAEAAATETTDTGVTVNTIETKVPTKEQVNDIGRELMGNMEYLGVPKVSLDVSFVALWQTEEYKDIAPLEHVKLCDTVTVIFDKLGINAKAKVVKTVYDVLLERYDKIELGDPKDTLASIVVEQQKFMGALIEDGIRRRTRLEVMDGLIEAEVFERTNETDFFSSLLQMTAENLSLALQEKYGSTNNFSTNIEATARGLSSEVTARQDGDANNLSLINQTAHSIDMDVTNGYSTAGITITIKDANGNTIDTGTGTINMTGVVTFSNNSYATQNYADSAASSAESSAKNYADTTTIDGGRITTGTISAARIDTDNLVVKKLETTATGSYDKISILGGTINFGNYVTIWESGQKLSFVYTDGVHFTDGSSSPTSGKFKVTGMAIVAENTSYVDGLQYASLITMGRAYFKGSICPYSSGSYSCGHADYKWSSVYANNATIQTSDRNEKHDIEPISEKYEQLFDKLEPVTYMRNDGDRVHIGFVAQDVKSAMDDVDISPMELSAYCRDDIEDKKTGETKTYLALRYGEFVALNTHMIQKQQARIDALEAEVAKLKQLVHELLRKE